MAFSNIIGHTKQITYLKRLLEREEMAHAYLFSGQKHLGKATVANAFLEEVVGCPLQTYPNIRQLDDQESISVKDIRALREHLALSGLTKGKKVALIDGAEAMSTAAQNALLKTLEEPRGDTILVLISHHPEKLLETIRSRCVEVRFSPVEQSAYPDGLEWSAGRPGIAKLLQDDAYREQEEEARTRAQVFLDAPQWKRIQLIDAWMKEKTPIPLMQWELLLHERFRDRPSSQPLRALLQLRSDLAYNNNKRLALIQFSQMLDV